MSKFEILWRNTFSKSLEKGAEKLNISIDSRQKDLMILYANELAVWNKKINLTAITTPQAVAEKHFLDSIVPAQYLKDCSSLLDIGTGGGFPGIVLKIMLPDTDVVLMDSSRKKVNFLKQVIRVLNLEKISAVHARAQDLHSDYRYHNKFDVVISRAFAQLATYIPLAQPFLNSNGMIWAMKKKEMNEEGLDSLKQTCSLKFYDYTLPFEKSERSIISIIPTDAMHE